LSPLSPSDPGVRRIEAAVLIDRRGMVWTPGLVDVTLRLGDRVVLAESPPPGVREELARALRDSAARMAGARGASGAFTVSFLADPAGGEQRFLGTAPGLPEAVAVIEALNEMDLQSLELHLSRGGTLDGQPPESRGVSMQVTLSALDPEDGFAPRSGAIEALRLPAGAGLRADAAVEEGEEPPDGEEIARVTAHGRTRAEALDRLQRGLARTEVAVRGGTTDKAFLTEVLDRAELTARKPADPGWLERLVASGEHLPRRGAEAALLAAAVAGYEEDLALARSRFYASAARGRPEVPKEIGRAVELRHRGHEYLFRVSRLDPRLFRVEVEGIRLEVLAEPPGRTGRTIACGGRSWRISLAAQESRLLVEVDGIPHRIERDAGGIVRSPAPAVVVSLAVREGDEVAAGDPLAVLEAMKMETLVTAPGPGRVRKVLVRRNAQVGTGGPLLSLEPLDRGGGATVPGPRVRFESLVPTTDGPANPRGEALEETRRLVLGFDADPRTVQRLVSGEAGLPGPEDLRIEEEILRAYADLRSLFRRRAEGDDRLSSEESLFTYLRDLDARGAGLSEPFLDKLRRALAHYGLNGLDRTPELEESLFRIAISHRQPRQVAAVLALLEGWLERGGLPEVPGLRELLDRVIAEPQGREPAVHDLAREVRYRVFDRPLLLAARERIYAAAAADLTRLAAGPGPEERRELIRSLVECPQPLHHGLSQRFAAADPLLRAALLEVMVRRYYRIRELGELAITILDGQTFAVADYVYRGSPVHLIATHTGPRRLAWSVEALVRLAGAVAPEIETVADLYLWRPGEPPAEDADADEIAALLARTALPDQPALPEQLRRVAVSPAGPAGMRHFTFRRTAGEGFAEDRIYRGIHPLVALRLELWRLRGFHLERLESPEAVYLFHGVARENPRDERLFAMAEVRDLTPVRDDEGHVIELPQLEHMLMEALAGIRRFQSRRAAGERLQWNRVLLGVWPPVDLRTDELATLVRRLTPLTEGLGLEKVTARCRIPDRESGELRDWVLEISNFEGSGVVLRVRRPREVPLKPLREYAQKVVDLRRRGLPYPYEVVKRLAPPQREAAADLPGEFVEHDLDESGCLVPVDRPYGNNQANVVVGVVRNFTSRYPEGMARVILLGDPSRGMGTLAEPECRRIVAALDLAREMGVPLEWFALSGGARIAMDSGTENMDWIALVLRRLVEFTQGGGEVNVIVPGINAGAQPYWNAEATMLMHTRGILIMTPEGAMVLTGKQALDYSGGVSAEDNQGIGGYERIMGPNGQAQYFARDLAEACQILLRHYEHSWVAPGERFPRPSPTRDPRDRDVRDFPHGGAFRTVGEVFSPTANPGRKKPFEIRRVMAAVSDQDHPPLERWYGMRDAEIAVVWDVHLGGHPVCLLGFESKPLPRLGWVPVYGPDQWTGGTLFPQASKKVARAINAASGNRPLVVLANLSGFDGSPESMRLWQLEYGAEIGRAVVNFRGPIVFCVVSRYHGGAFVVFSHALHDNLEVAALEGTHASVIGGAPAAAVIFAREVDRRTRQDARVVELERAIADPDRGDRARLLAQLEETREAVRSESLSEVAEEFDHIHSVQRAREVGSVHHILAPERLRPYLIEAVERGMEREEACLTEPRSASSLGI
jgi:acetyl-CoA carboxylase carboxyltransferase component/pyruvate/2-oxoglutarate dehydrogenase complex dihydrolipoamide acyltransferase (E2) component